MKNIITSILLLITSNVFGQQYTGSSSTTIIGASSLHKPTVEKSVDNPIFIVVYKQSENYMWYGNGIASPSNRVVTKIQGFNSLDEVMNWINTPNYSTSSERKDVAVSPENIIAIYDISNSKRINLKLKTENKVKAKHIEVQEEKWVNKYYEIDNP